MEKKLAFLSLFFVGFILTLVFANVIFLLKSDLSNQDSDAATIKTLDYVESEESDIGDLISTNNALTVETTPVPEYLLNKWVDIKNLPDYRNLPTNGGISRDLPYSYTTVSYDWGNSRREYLDLNGKLWFRTKELNTAWSEWRIFNVYGVVTSGRLTRSFDIHLTDQYNIHYVRGGKIYHKYLDLANPTNPDFFNVTFLLDGVGSGPITSFTQTRLKQGYATGQYLTRNGKIHSRNTINGWSQWTDITGSLKLDEISGRVVVQSYDTAIIPGGYTQEYLTLKNGDVYTRFTRN
jgi:hypothetical protein